MLRLLIGSGLLLMVVGFGAAGWQYWQGLPAAPEAELADAPAPAGAAALPQVWLATTTGAPVTRGDLQAYLTQERFVPGRLATVTFTAPLTALLSEGETLPAAAFLEVFADIRAATLAEGFCPALRQAFAQSCAVHSARVVPGSVDAASGTARLRVEMAFAQAPQPEAMPDLATHVFADRLIDWQPAADTPPPASAEVALAAVAQTALAACAVPDVAPACRVMALTLDWSPGPGMTGQARVGWLAPLPEGMRTAPPIAPPPEG